jgi:hypothetical protein
MRCASGRRLDVAYELLHRRVAQLIIPTEAELTLDDRLACPLGCLVRFDENLEALRLHFPAELEQVSQDHRGGRELQRDRLLSPGPGHHVLDCSQLILFASREGFDEPL